MPLDLLAEAPSGTAGDASTIGTAGAPSTGTAGAGGALVDMSGVPCGGHRCASKQICCILDGSCIDAATAMQTCPKPATAPASAGTGARPCGSTADCAANEFCGPLIGCLGPGTCLDRNNCGTSTGAKVCGCDGVTYVNVQTACRSGITSQAPGACGTVSTPGIDGHDPIIFCGRDDQCPTGQLCCPIYGRCVDSRFPALCTPPPPGTRQSCLTDQQCPDFEFCDGTGCSGPGGCVILSPSYCTGIHQEVCGCDGKNYINAGCARAAGVRVLETGGCTLQ